MGSIFPKNWTPGGIILLLMHRGGQIRIINIVLELKLMGYIACVKNVYKKWLNLELYKNPIVSSKFKKIEKLAEIVYSMRPEIGKYCWDKTIFRDEKELIWDVPEVMIESNV